jgi:uncharacterized protein (DUF1697 family)
MEVLRKAFEAPGFENIRTILASGNVLFETDYTDENILEQNTAAIIIFLWDPGTLARCRYAWSAVQAVMFNIWEK